MNIAIIGSRTFPLTKGVGYIFELIAGLRANDRVLVRPSEGVDYIAKTLAGALDIPVTEFRATGGRELVFKRDEDLVAYADRIEAFFDPDHVMEGGTGHIVEVALRSGKPVRAWTVRDGELELVGSDT
jgi:hypothetical protein